MVARNRRLSRRRPTGLALERREGEEIVIRHGDDVLTIWVGERRAGDRVKLVLRGSQRFQIVRRELLAEETTDAA